MDIPSIAMLSGDGDVVVKKCQIVFFSIGHRRDSELIETRGRG